MAVLTGHGKITLTLRGCCNAYTQKGKMHHDRPRQGRIGPQFLLRQTAVHVRVGR